MSRHNNTFLISTPIYYVNAPRVHLGHALSTLVADVLARRARLHGQNVHFSTGTDEHGAKVARAAKESDKNPQQFVDENAANFQESFDNLNISYDHFVRTTAESHKTGAQKFLQAIYDNGYVYKDTYKGLYCEGCEAFVKENELTEDGLCPLHKTEPEKLEEENWFFKLSAFANKLEQEIGEDRINITPENKKREVLQNIQEGLEDFSISRAELEWGIPIPWDQGQVTYVWVEALSNYLTTIGYGTNPDTFDNFWPTDINVLGKDIARFHCIYWPALLWAAGLEAPETFLVHSFLNVEGHKMSKSLGNVIYPEDWAKKYSTDGARFLIASELPHDRDGNISREDMADKYNGTLKGGLGNLFSRMIVLGQKAGLAEIKNPNGAIAQDAQTKTQEVQKQAEKAYEQLDIKRALETTWQLIHYADKLLDEQKPWKVFKQDTSYKIQDTNLEETIFTGLELVRQVAVLAAPVIPETTRAIHEALKIEWTETLPEGKFKELKQFGAFELKVPEKNVHLFS